MTSDNGLISFIGAGPGDPDLLTLRAADRLRQAEVVVWASSLIPEAVLELTAPTAEVHDSAAMTLEDVLGVYEQRPGARIVRLHSGDPSLYGALQEQLDWCEANARRYEVVPGVTSVAACAALLGRELTLPAVSQTLVVTRVPSRTGASMPVREQLRAYARHGGTLAILLSGAHPERVVEELLAEGSAFDASTPAAVVVRASWPEERFVRTTVAGIPEAVQSLEASRSVTILVGDALAAPGARSHLYAPSFSHRFRARSAAGSTAGRPRARVRRGVR
jgi:precorrin-4/cobalt-precorrin-4 C11-methyltransferase